jgi:hypothetical protein
MKRSKTLYLVAIFAWLVAAAGGCLPANAQSFAYVANANSNDVWAYKIDSTTGALSLVASIATGAHPVSVAVDPSGKFVYVANFGDNTVSAYTINSTTGALSPVSGETDGSLRGAVQNNNHAGNFARPDAILVSSGYLRAGRNLTRPTSRNCLMEMNLCN